MDLADLVLELADIPSHTDDVAGVRRVMERVADLIGVAAEVRELPPRRVVTDRGELAERAVAPAMIFRQPGDFSVLLSGHADTVYHEHVQPRREGGRLIGPGVADMKGGLVVMTEALRRYTGELGWTLVVTPDEEVGSPSSADLLRELAPGHIAGLVAEPAQPDGSLVSLRGGHGAYDLVIRGRAAHVGKRFADGRSAVHLAAEVTGVLAKFNEADGVTVNVGAIDGGGPRNVVADTAVLRIDVRVATAELREAVENDLRRLLTVLGRRDGTSVTLHGGFTHPPRDLAPPLAELMAGATWTPSGGVNDGNILADAGLPVLDSLGVVGGDLHSPREWCDVASIKARAQQLCDLLHAIESSDL